MAYWRRHPPMHELLAAYVGFKAPEPVTSLQVPPSTDDPSGIGGLIQQFPNGFVPADRQ